MEFKFHTICKGELNFIADHKHKTNFERKFIKFLQKSNKSIFFYSCLKYNNKLNSFIRTWSVFDSNRFPNAINYRCFQTFFIVYFQAERTSWFPEKKCRVSKTSAKRLSCWTWYDFPILSFINWKKITKHESTWFHTLLFSSQKDFFKSW